MYSLLLSITVSVSLAAATSVVTQDQFDPKHYAAKDVIIRDFCVIGGGSSGTYAGIKLRDLHKSVVIVEKAAVLGGHTNSYTDAKTGARIDYGVQSYANQSIVRNFFARFNIPLEKYTFDSKKQVFADFERAQAFPDFKDSFNFTGYKAELAKYPSLSDGWSLPKPVPQDLLLPFRDFLTKYSLQDLAFTIWEYSWGCGDILSQPTVYLLKALPGMLVDGLLNGMLTTARRDNHEVYRKALAEFGQDALVSSTVHAAQRSDKDKVKLVVKTPSGNKLIIASKVIISIPPKIDNMKTFALDSKEKSIFEQFSSSSWYVFVVTDTGLPNGYSFQNVRPSSVDTFRIPPLPGMYNIHPTKVDSIFTGWYGGPNAVSESKAKADIIKTIENLRKSLGIKETMTNPVKFLACDSHTPFQLVVPSKAIENGFYSGLQGLQGYRNTWYTGAAFVAHHADELWTFTDHLLRKLTV